jgi:anti-sigma B factor antagonist
VRSPRNPDLGRDRDPRRERFEISKARDGDPVGTVAIKLAGELDIASADELDAAIRDSEHTDIGWIVVDLSEVSFVDSTGLSVLLHAKKRNDGRLSYIPSRHDAVTRLLELTGTIEILGFDGREPDQ